MKITKSFWSIVAIALVFGGVIASRAETASVTWRQSLPNALSEAKRTGKPVFIDFTASWCGPCQEMKRGTFTNSKVVAELRRWVPVRIDVDKQEKVAEKYSVEAMPTLAIVKPNGSVLTRAVGYRDASQLLAFLKTNYAKARR